MKTIGNVLLCFLCIMLFATPASAVSLACDLPPAGVVITQTRVEITPVDPVGSAYVVSGLAVIQGNDFKLLDLEGMAVGKYKFRAQWADSSGWWSDWDPFFEAGKPPPLGGKRIIP